MAVMGFIMPGANFALDAKRARKANKTKQFFKDIGKDAATSKVRERNPNSYQAWFAERAKGTGAETIFVDVDKVRGAMVRNGINQEQLQFLLPDLYKQLQAIGANSGVDVTIPTSVYAARLVDTAFGQDLQSDMRLNPDDMSINDNNEYVKSRDTRVAELVKLSEEMTASDEILAESAKVVENRVVSEIMAVGKYTELEAKAMAAAHVAFAVVNAQSLNMTPDQFDIQYGMATRGEGQAAPAAPLEQANQFDQAGQRRTDTPEFKEWSGGAEIVKASEASTRTFEDGMPVVGEAFHGTNTTIDEFSVTRTGEYGPAIYTTSSSFEAGQYAFGKANSKTQTNEGANIVPVYVAFRKPFTRGVEAFWNQFAPEIDGVRTSDEGAVKNAIAAGYDGIISQAKQSNGKNTIHYIAFNPAQIKSVYNRGTWSSTTPNIMEQASRIDADYMTAVESGNVVEQQRMVDEAAKAAGYWRRDNYQRKWAFKKVGITPSEIENAGMPLDEATEKAYNELNRVEAGMFEGLKETLIRDGNIKVFESQKSGFVWRRYQFVANGEPAGFVIINSPLDVQRSINDNGIGNQNFIHAKYTAPKYRQQGISTTLVEAVLEDFGTLNADYVRSPEAQQTYARYLERGFIKSADPITRDAAGNVIPLSQRFNIRSASILEQAAYRGEHTAPTNDGYAQPLSNLGGIFPDDIYSQDAARLYGTGNEQQDRQAISIIQSARNKPNQSIKIYRAVPFVLSNADKIADIEKQKAEIQRRGYERWAKKQENPLTYDQLNAELDRLKSLPEEAAVVKPQINDGDWVTISKQYAVEHGESALNGNYKIVTKTVPVKHLFTDGNSIQEWGYDSKAQGILEQAAPSPSRRGSFDPTRLLTTLNTKADLSTFLHESSHFFFSVYTDIASRPGAPARIAADVQILLDSFGVKDIAAWNAMTFEEQRKYQEQFAYNFEIYLFEGKAPSIEMQGLFERFSKWLRRVYTSISTELNDIYRREFGEDLPILTDEIRGVMGRMLASEAQIKRAEAVNEMKPQFQTQAESGMDDARWAAYQAMIEEAHDQAVTDLTKASLRQMEWLSNARSRLLKNMQSKHDAIRKEMRTEIEAEVMAEPLYMAMSILKTGQGRAKNGELVQFNDKFKLNLEAVKKMLPSEEIAKLGYGKYGMVSEDGIPPDMVAEIVGFVSGDELVLALLTAKPAKEEIAARLDKRMMDEYGKMNTPEAREAAVQAAIHNEARERFVAVEARFIAKATQPVRVMIDAAKAAARQIVGAKKIDDISPGEYAAAEARASRDAAEAYKDRQTPDAASKSTYTRVYNEQIAKGVDEATAVAEATSKAADASTKAQGKADAYKAKYGDRTPEQVIIRAKQAQVLQNQLVKEATSSLEEVDTAVKDFRKFFGSDEKIAKSRNMDLVDAARAILSYYGFGKVGKNPADYIRKLEAYNPEMYAEIQPLISQASTGVQDYTQMSMDDFRMLRDVVDALWAQSRRDKQITVAGKKIALDGVLSELDARLNEIGVPTTVPGEKSALTTKQKFAAHLYSAKALLRRVENWADATDGAGGVGAFTKYIYRPVKDAVNAYRVDRNNYVKRFVDLVSTLELPVGKITSPEIDYTFGVGNGGIGKAELLGAMLHTGNESNYKKLLIGRNWGEFNPDDSVNTSRWDSFVQRMIAEGVLTKNDFDFLQSVWDLNEEIKPIAQKAHRDLYGYYFKEVEATQFTNTFGTYRGGYVPAKTDAAIVRDAQRQAKAEELDADFRSSMPSTGMGFTKSRVEYNKPLSLDVRLMAKHIDDVLRFANIQPAIKDALRIVNNRGFADKLSRIDPTVVEFMLLPWLNRTARQSTNEPGRNKVIDNFWRTLRSRTGMSIMFANLRNALQQVTGLFPSALKVSKGALKDSLFTYLASPRKTAEAIAGLSPFMNERMHSQIFEIQDQMNDLLLNPSKFDKIQKWSQHHGYFLQSAFQNFVDIVTWNGKYNQVLSEIGTTLSDSEAQAEAIQQADAAVRSTQGSMSAEDVAAFEVGSPFYKTFVQFTGYFNMLANLNTDEYVKVLRDLGWRGNKGKLVSIYMLGFLAPTLVADAIARSLGAGWDNDDDGYLDDVADWFFGSQVRAGAAMVPFGSAAYTAFAAGFTARTYDDRITSSPSIGSLEASTVGVGKAVVNLASDDKELTGRNVRDVLTLITNATGVPVSVLGRPIGYQMEIERGKIEPTDPIDYMRGLITGVPSAESKKK
jgi:GNAT superfamily N-acetyltransferase